MEFGFYFVAVFLKMFVVEFYISACYLDMIFDVVKIKTSHK